MKAVKQGTKHKLSRVLVIRLSALGDVAMTLPVIYSVAKAHPDVCFDVLTRPFFARIFINRPVNVQIIGADFKARYNGLCGMLRLFRELSSNGYGRVADLHNVSRSWILDWLFRLAGIRVVMVDKMREGRRKVLRGEGRQPSFINRYVEVFRQLDLGAELTFRRLFEEIVPDAPLNIPAGAVGIAPFARYATKTYPPEFMEQVVRMLSERSVPVFLFGGRGHEAEVLGQWAARYGGCTSLAGRYEIETELALMSRLTLMVAMDSANQHLASLCGVRALTVWGGTTPACGFMAYGQKAEDQLCLGLKCQPCSIGGSPDCRLDTLECLRGISPEGLAARITSML